MTPAKVNRFFEWVMNLALLNFMWILFSLPIVTVFAASTGLCRVIQQHRTELDREGIFSLYWRSFVKQLLPATGLGFTLLLLLLVVASNFMFAHQFMHVTWLYMLFMIWSIFISAVYVSVVLFTFPVLATQKHSMTEALKIAFLLGLQRLPQSIAMTALLAFMVFAYYVMPVFIPIIGFSLIAFLIIRYTDRTVRPDERLIVSEAAAS